MKGEKIREQFGRGLSKRISVCTLVFRLLGCEHKLTVAKKDFTGFSSETRPDCPKRPYFLDPRKQNFECEWRGVTIQHGTCRNAGPVQKAVRDCSEHLCLVRPEHLSCHCTEARGKDRGSHDGTDEVPSSTPLLSLHDVARQRP